MYAANRNEKTIPIKKKGNSNWCTSNLHVQILFARAPFIQ